MDWAMQYRILGRMCNDFYKFGIEGHRDEFEKNWDERFSRKVEVELKKTDARRAAKRAEAKKPSSKIPAGAPKSATRLLSSPSLR